MFESGRENSRYWGRMERSIFGPPDFVGLYVPVAPFGDRRS